MHSDSLKFDVFLLPVPVCPSISLQMRKFSQEFYFQDIFTRMKNRE